MKKKTVLYVLWSIFATIGVILWIIATAYGVVSKQNQKRMELTYAVITELDDTGDDGDSYVDYEFGGEEFTHKRLGYYSTSMYVGQYIDIYVDPQNPEKIMSKHGRIVAMAILGGLGTVFGLLGFCGIAYLQVKKVMKRRLFREGKRLTGVIDTISQNIHVEVNGEHPYYAVVVVRDENTGEEKFFKSDNLWDVDMSTIKEGDSAVVYVDSQNEKKYFVDVTGANAIMGSLMDELF